MKKVLLLGDSIRMGYDEYVRDLLKGKAEVYFDEDNGRFAAFTLWQVNQMFQHHGKFDVVHWNNGYWDMNVEAPMTQAMHPLEEYLHFLRRILGEIRNNGAKVIFATTTPVPESAEVRATAQVDAFLHYRNEWVRTYNDAAKKLMAEENVPVNDLYALCLESPTYYKCPDMLHLTQEGYLACARQAVEWIERLL